RLTASPLAVAIPTRRPVNEPGPSPTATRSTAGQPPAASAQRSISASSPVAWRGRPRSFSPSWASARTSPSRQAQAAVSGVAVSKPTTTSEIASYFTRKTEVPTFWPLTNQVTWWRPTLVEVILLTYSVPCSASCGVSVQRCSRFGNFTQTVYLTSAFRLLKKAPFLLPTGQTCAGFALRERPQAT